MISVISHVLKLLPLEFFELVQYYPYFARVRCVDWFLESPSYSLVDFRQALWLPWMCGRARICIICYFMCEEYVFQISEKSVHAKSPCTEFKVAPLFELGSTQGSNPIRLCWPESSISTTSSQHILELVSHLCTWDRRNKTFYIMSAYCVRVLSRFSVHIALMW